MHLVTKVIDLDEGFRLARTMRLSVGSKDIIAPKRALSASQSRYHNENILTNDVIKGLVEVYRHIDQEKIHKMISDNKEVAKFSYGLSSSLKKVDTTREVVIGILEFNSRGNIPNPEETELLLDLLNNPYFDIVASPIIPKLPFEKYTKFLDEFIKVYESSSFIPALSPCIPHYSRSDIPRLFEYYAKQDIFSKNFICVDFNGSNPISQYTFVSMIVREAIFLEREFGEPVFLHAVNLKYGKATKKQIVVPAKDLLIFTIGFNSFGANHKILPIAGAIGDYELRTKVLDRNNYGYYSLEIAGNLIKDIGTYEISLKDVLTDYKMAKLFNAERQGLEAKEISDAIRERRCKNYIESKEYIKKEGKILKKINKVHMEAMQQKL